MLAPLRTPLAWRNLTHDRRRLLLALGGIGFAVLLMCMQLGFREALFDSTVAVIRKLNADLVITSRTKYTIIVRETFTRQRLVQARACPGVEAAWPLYIETQLSILKERTADRKTADKGQPIRVLAFHPGDPVFDLAEVRRHAPKLLLPRTAMFDERSKSEYGKLRPGTEIELAGSRVHIVGSFVLGTDFANDGNLIMSALCYSSLFGKRGPGRDGLGDVDIGLVKVAAGHDVDSVKAALEGTLSAGDVKVQTKREFENQERRFWGQSTPIGYIFWLGAMMGFVVGVIICYQILYADIADHMGEFATLKAMGYQNGYFIGVVFQEALLLSLLGFMPGVLVSKALSALVARRTGLLLELAAPLVGLVLALTIAMCIVSGSFAMRKVLAADPAELFR